MILDSEQVTNIGIAGTVAGRAEIDTSGNSNFSEIDILTVVIFFPDSGWLRFKCGSDKISFLTELHVQR